MLEEIQLGLGLSQANWSLSLGTTLMYLTNFLKITLSMLVFLIASTLLCRGSLGDNNFYKSTFHSLRYKLVTISAASQT